ncbi:RidA family protein [Streptomyces sp. NPDC048473]|uniref:RidA family protein n=1 Tax=unclassified Streptomyces TaxID=2593676 RepID=UPI0037218B67
MEADPGWCRARANSDLSRLLHLTIYLTDIEDRGIFDEVYAEVVPRPYPARCCVAVAALAIEGMRVEVTALAAQAHGAAAAYEDSSASATSPTRECTSSPVAKPATSQPAAP